MADKDVDGVIAALAASPALAGARVIATALDLPRAMPAAELAGRWRAARSGGPAPSVTADAGAALDRALSGPRGPVVVAGSLYLVGAVRARLVDDPLLRDPIDETR
jgi:folylpolyglutamate synthase/dihydropteroate synthase